MPRSLALYSLETNVIGSSFPRVCFLFVFVHVFFVFSFLTWASCHILPLEREHGQNRLQNQKFKFRNYQTKGLQ